MDQLREHNFCSKLTMDINAWMRYMMFIYYYLTIPILDISMMIILFETNMIFKLILYIIIIICALNLFIFNHILTATGIEAHNCYAILNTIMARKRMRIYTRFKVNMVIERLAVPLIGMYCLDLFPFTNYEFFLFIANCISQFFLFLDLL